MEPREEVLERAPEPRKDERRSRFHIKKLEERIAPKVRGYPPSAGHCPPGQYRNGNCTPG